MTLNSEQLAAIYKLAITMVAADGKVYKSELDCVVLELLKFGVSPEQEKNLRILAESMEPAKAIEIVSGLNSEAKKYVASFLGTIMAVDGNIDEKEHILWVFVSSACKLPRMSVGEAISNMSKL